MRYSLPRRDPWRSHTTPRRRSRSKPPTESLCSFRSSILFAHRSFRSDGPEIRLDVQGHAHLTGRAALPGFRSGRETLHRIDYIGSLQSIQKADYAGVASHHHHFDLHFGELPRLDTFLAKVTA